MSRRNALLLLVLAATWGAVYPLTSIALRGLPAPWVVLGRSACAFLVLAPLPLRTDARGLIRSAGWRLAVAGLLQAAIPLTLLTLGQQYVSAGVAGILSAAQPVFVSLLVFGIDRSIRRMELVGVATGLAGIFLLFARDLVSGSTTAWGGVAVLVAAFFFAAGAVFIHRSLSETPPLLVATAAMVLTTLLMAPVALPGEGPGAATAAEIACLVVLGVGGTAFALVLFYQLIGSVRPTKAALAWYLAPGFAVLYDIPLSGFPSLTALAGLTLITVGSIVAARSADDNQRGSRDTAPRRRAVGGNGSAGPSRGGPTRPRAR